MSYDYSDEFDWDDVGSTVVQQAVEKVAIFSNPNGDIVVRQERCWNDEHDTFIVIARGHALTAAYAILEAAGMGDIQFHRACGGGYEDVDIPACTGPDHVVEHQQDVTPKDKTAAERQKRYRERHRNGVTEPTVTHNGELPLRLIDQNQEVLQAAE